MRPIQQYANKDKLLFSFMENSLKFIVQQKKLSNIIKLVTSGPPRNLNGKYQNGHVTSFTYQDYS